MGRNFPCSDGDNNTTTFKVENVTGGSNFTSYTNRHVASLCAGLTLMIYWTGRRG